MNFINLMLRRKYSSGGNPRHCLIVFVITAVFSLGTLAEGTYQDVERIVAVGDIHGDYDNFKKVLTEAGLINRRGNWIGGETHFVQLGDLPDRGPDTDKIIEHMRKLENQAEEAGGKVHALIGNHEAMNVYGDLRYVHPGEYAAFRSSQSRDLRRRYYDSVIAQLRSADETFTADKAFREAWMNEHPLGYVEHRLAWSPAGELGSWVVGNKAIVKVNRSLFLHGGVSAKLLGLDIAQINAQVARELGGQLPDEPGLSEADDGPLWYRGLASADEASEAAHVDAVLVAFDVDRIVVGHTPGYGTILPRFNGKVLVADTGIAEYYGGHIASLLIEQGQAFTLQQKQKISLPSNAEEMLAYVEAVSKLDNPTPALQRLLETLKAE